MAELKRKVCTCGWILPFKQSIMVTVVHEDLDCKIVAPVRVELSCPVCQKVYEIPESEMDLLLIQ